MTTSNKNKAISLQVKEILAQDGDLLRNIIREVIQEFLGGWCNLALSTLTKDTQVIATCKSGI